MKPRSLAVVITLALVALPSPAAEVNLNGHAFALPDGFTVELAAGADLIPRPISASFDLEGRLYVTDSAGLNLPPAEQLKDPRGRILRLADNDGDGRFDRSVVFADRVMFPQGCLWHAGSVYAAGPPSIWKFTDTDGDGVADRREEWYQGNVLTGCANDVHGPHLGPEGMLYWTKGAFSRLDLKDGLGRPINDRCAHIFGAWPDRSGFETVISGGMDNPVEVAFTVEGEPIVISTFIDLSQPGRRDGLAHAVYGGVFGKINDVVDEPMVKRTGALLPAMTHFGPAAACALMRYDGDVFGPEYRENLFGTLFNLRKVTRHVLLPQGATYATQDTDFLVSDQPDFRPTDVLEDVDGSLLVVDTGGWYKLCCPSSQLAKADVLGGIYRVRRQPPPAIASSRLSPEQRSAGYARLARPPRLKEDSAEVILKRLALKADPSSAHRLRDTLAQRSADASTSSESARLARIAAEGLGRIRDREALPLLFDAITASKAPDRFLEHSLLFALIEIGDPQATRPYARSENPRVRSAALLVLDQIGNSELKPEDIVPWLNASSPELRETARWIAKRHPEWGGELAAHLRTRLTDPASGSEEKLNSEGLLSLIARSTDGQAFLAEVVTQPGFRPETRVAAVDAMTGSGVKELPPAWRSALVTVLTSTTNSPSRAPDGPGVQMPTLAAALSAVRTLPLPKQGDPEITEALHGLARNGSQSPARRLDALAGLPAGTAIDDDEFRVLRSALDPSRPPAERLAAATAVGRLKATPSQLDLLTGAVATAGPIELPRLLAAFASGEEAALGEKLLAALKSSKALRSIRPEELIPQLAHFPESVRHAANTLLDSVRSDASQDRMRLETLLAELQKLDGQVRRGQALFNSPKVACASCHRLGYLGGDVGPDLTAIGTVRTERDLLEALIYPSASFVRSYEPWMATSKDGEDYSGVLRRETPEEIVLATGPGAEVRLARSDLTDLRSGSVSTMPAGLDEQLTRQDLADLLAFLKNTKWGAN